MRKGFQPTAQETPYLPVANKAAELERKQQAKENLKHAERLSVPEIQAEVAALEDSSYPDYYIPKNEQELQELAKEIEAQEQAAQSGEGDVNHLG